MNICDVQGPHPAFVARAIMHGHIMNEGSVTKFKPAKYDRLTLGVHLLRTCFIAGYAELLFVSPLLPARFALSAFIWIFVIVTLGICLASWARAPRRYEVTSWDVVIERNVGKKKIVLTDIQDLRRITATDTHGWNKNRSQQRKVLIAGAGLFPLSHHTGLVLRATGYQPGVMISRISKPPFVITVTDPDGFIAAVLAAREYLVISKR